MPKQKNLAPPNRKEPGLIGKLLSSITKLIAWLIISLIISIIIEWIGMKYFWPEQRENHAKAVLATDKAYLTQQATHQATTVKKQIVRRTLHIVKWAETEPWLKRKINGANNRTKNWAKSLSRRYYSYFQAAGSVLQTFIIRLTLILFSLPIFVMAAITASVDGLVERDLRRWGGGRESSNVFNLAKKSITPAFISACVIYISLPFSINPVIIISPFAMLYFISVRIAFERLKKYF